MAVQGRLQTPRNTTPRVDAPPTQRAPRHAGGQNIANREGRGAGRRSHQHGPDCVQDLLRCRLGQQAQARGREEEQRRLRVAALGHLRGGAGDGVSVRTRAGRLREER